MDPNLFDMMGNDGNEFPATAKTEEEIKKLTLEENMTELKRTMHILCRGLPLQKLSIYLNLHKILLEQEAFAKVLPLVIEEIVTQNEECQIEGARSMNKLINKAVKLKPNFLSPQNLDKSQLIQIFRMCTAVIRIWNKPVLDEWALLFNNLLKKLPYTAIAKECEETLLNLSEQSQHTMSKYVAARMIGFIAENGVKQPGLLYDRAKILCQDSDIEVRRIMAMEVMTKVCHVVGTDLTENKFLEKILELLYDSDQSVKLATIDTIVDVLDILSDEFKEGKMLNVFVDLMTSVNEEVVKKMSYHCGKIVYRLEHILAQNHNQMIQIQSIYRDWGFHKNPEVRKNVFFNMPYMIQTFENKEYFKGLYLKALKDTKDQNIRYTAIAILHEMAKIVGPDDANTLFRESFENLLKEEDPIVREKMVKNFHDVAKVLQSREDKEDYKTDNGKELIRQNTKDLKEKDKKEQEMIKESCFNSLIAFGEIIIKQNAWRLEMTFMENLEQCIDHFDIREIYEKYINFLFARLTRSLKEIKSLILSLVIKLLYENHYSQITNAVVKKIQTDLYMSSNFQNRLLFLDLYDKLTTKFSRNFMKNHQLNEWAVSLLNDKVVPVKRKFLSIATNFRKMLFYDDEVLQMKLEEGLMKISNDKKDLEMAKLGMETQRELKSLTSYFFDEFEEQDNLRLEHEESLRLLEEKEIEELKRRQMEENKDKSDYLFSYGSLLNSKKVGSKTVWKNNVPPSSKIIKATGIINNANGKLQKGFSITEEDKKIACSDKTKPPPVKTSPSIPSNLNPGRKKSDSVTVPPSHSSMTTLDKDAKTPTNGVKRTILIEPITKPSIVSLTQPSNTITKDKENTTIKGIGTSNGAIRASGTSTGSTFSTPSTSQTMSSTTGFKKKQF